MTDDRTDSALEARLAALEERLDALTARIENNPAPAAPAPDPDPTGGTAFWALEGLKARTEAPGAVMFTGTVDVGVGHLDHQWGRPTQTVLDRDWTAHADTLAALGHPVRLGMLRLLLDGEHTAAQLVDQLELTSTGVAYHHLHQMAAAGWVETPGKGRWGIPAGRVIPLMAIIVATEHSA